MCNSYVRLEIDPETLKAIKPFTGQRVELALRAIDNQGERTGPMIVQSEHKLGPYDEYLAACFERGVFAKNVDVLKALGTETHWQNYCRKLPCDISGGFEDDLHGEPRSIYAHVSDAGRPTSGRKGHGSNKPLYSGIPMRQSLHEKQHSQGWNWIFNYWCEIRGYDKAAKDKLNGHYRSSLNWARSLRDRRLNHWAMDQLTEIIGGGNKGAISPQAIQDWAAKNDVLHRFPLKLERSIIRGTPLHQTIEAMKNAGVARLDIGPQVGWNHKSTALKNVYENNWVTCENPKCRKEFAPPTPLNKPYSRRFCSAECATQAGNRVQATPASNSLTDAHWRFLYG